MSLRCRVVVSGVGGPCLLLETIVHKEFKGLHSKYLLRTDKAWDVPKEMILQRRLCFQALAVKQEKR